MCNARATVFIINTSVVPRTPAAREEGGTLTGNRSGLETGYWVRVKLWSSNGAGGE
jgi:hypothetical protein